jgi:hypothetical protein
MNCVTLAHYRDKWRAVVGRVILLGYSSNAAIFMIS